MGTNLENVMSYTVGIIGRGFVGGAMYENFKDVFNTLVWDVEESKRNVATFQVVLS